LLPEPPTEELAEFAAGIVRTGDSAIQQQKVDAKITAVRSIAAKMYPGLKDSFDAGTDKTMSSEIGSSGLPLSDQLEEWMVKNAYKNNYHIQGTTDLKMIFDDVKIPLKDQATNNNYKGRLGKGRINMANSLTQVRPSVRMSPINFADNHDNAFVAGDTIRISGDFI
jgi:hypothetical protein